jgi:hypothetical protein
MQQPSYLQRISGGAPSPAVLSPPRVLFRPAALPIEVAVAAETMAETIAAPVATHEGQAGLRAMVRSPSNMTSASPASLSVPPRSTTGPQPVASEPAPESPVPIGPGGTRRTLSSAPRTTPKDDERPAPETSGAAASIPQVPDAGQRAPSPVAPPAPAQQPTSNVPDAAPVQERVRPAPAELGSIVVARAQPELRAPVFISPVAISAAERGAPASSTPTKAASEPPVVQPEPEPRRPSAPEIQPPSHAGKGDAGAGAGSSAFVPLTASIRARDDSRMTGSAEASPVATPQPGKPPEAPASTSHPVPPEPPAVRLRPHSLFAGALTDHRGEAQVVDAPKASARDLAPAIRLEPPAVAPRPSQSAEDGKTSGVRIGSLEVRITPAAPPAPDTRRSAKARTAPSARPASPLSRSFRSFGLVQG